MYHRCHLVRRRVFVVKFCTGQLPQMRRFHLCVSAGGDLLQFLLASHIHGITIPCKRWGSPLYRNERKMCRNMQTPKSVKEYHTFCGMVNFLSTFCKHLRELLIPIYKLTKKRARFQWTDTHQKAFEQIKQLLIKPPDHPCPYFHLQLGSTLLVPTVVLHYCSVFGSYSGYVTFWNICYTY